MTYQTEEIQELQLMTAAEARELTDKINTPTPKRVEWEKKEVTKEINKAINEGQYFCILRFEVSDSTKALLESMNYFVGQTVKYQGYHTVVRWNKVT